METVSTPPPSPQQQGPKRPRHLSSNMVVFTCFQHCYSDKGQIFPSGVISRSQCSGEWKGTVNHWTWCIECHQLELNYNTPFSYPSTNEWIITDLVTEENALWRRLRWRLVSLLPPSFGIVQICSEAFSWSQIIKPDPIRSFLHNKEKRILKKERNSPMKLQST